MSRNEEVEERDEVLKRRIWRKLSHASAEGATPACRVVYIKTLARGIEAFSKAVNSKEKGMATAPVLLSCTVVAILIHNQHHSRAINSSFNRTPFNLVAAK